MKRSTNIYLRIAFILVLLVSLLSLPVLAADGEPSPASAADHHSHDGWTAWGDEDIEKTSLPAKGGQFYLTSDIELPATFSITKTTDLCLNGHVIRLTAESGAVIEICSNSELHIYDCSETDRYFKCVSGGAWEDAGTELPGGTVIALEDYDSGTAGGTYVKTTGGVITGGKSGGILMEDDLTCALTVFGGNIVGNVTPGNGGGINVTNGRVFLHGGCIAGNVSEKMGGGICFRIDSYYLWAPPVLCLEADGGCITGNTAKTSGGGIGGIEISDLRISEPFLINGNRASEYGGGIYTGGTLAVNGGIVKGNRAGIWGGGLYANTTGHIQLSGGLITGNTASNGGGVFVNNEMTMSGGTVSGNTAKTSGGGIRLGSIDNNKAEGRKLTVSGGTISDNSASNGGGIYVGIGGSLTASNLTMTGNSAANYGGGVDIDTDGTAALTDCGITNNSAGKNGGGVCFAGNGTTLGGKVKITENTVNGKPGNVFIKADEAVAIAELTDGAEIGITLQAAAENSNSQRRFTANGSKSDEKYFYSDDTSRNYGPFYNDAGYLDIVLLHLHTDANGNSVNFKEWTDPASLPNGGAWYLGTDVTLKRDWEPTLDTKLCLNGHIISSNSSRCLWLEETNFDLYDETSSAVHYFQYNKGREWTLVGDSTAQAAVALSDFSLDTVSEGTIIAVPGGVITGWDMFISVYSNLADEPRIHFNMFGGNIVGIGSDYAEPVGILGDVTFTMYGGSIAGNLFPYGDIIRNRLGSMNLLGGTVTGNIASNAIVNNDDTTKLTITGSAAIHDNISEKGAVYTGTADMVIGGSALIRGNVTSNGTTKNVYVENGYKIILDSPKQGLTIGVSTNYGPTAGSPVLFSGSASESDAAYFFSDNGYTIRFKPLDNSENALYLTENSGLASVFGNGSGWFIAVLAAVVAAGIAAVAVIGKKKKAAESSREQE